MIYFLRHPEKDCIKIGVTTNYHARLSQLIAEHGDLELMGIMDGNRETEKSLHQWFSDCRAVNMSGREWFAVTPELIEYIQQNTHLDLPSRKPHSSDMTSRIPVTGEMHEKLTLIKNALGANVTFNDALDFLITVAAQGEQDATMAGRKLREEFQQFMIERESEAQ